MNLRAMHGYASAAVLVSCAAAVHVACTIEGTILAAVEEGGASGPSEGGSDVDGSDDDGSTGDGGGTDAPAATCDVPTPTALPAAHVVVGDGTPTSCTYEALSAAAAGGGYVTFACGTGDVVIKVTSPIAVTSATVIDGAGAHVTLDGGGTHRILVVRDNQRLSVRNLTFINGVAAQSEAKIEAGTIARDEGMGGAIAGLFQSRVEVIDCTFEHCSAHYGGGAVGVAAGSALTIVGSTFKNTTSWFGGATYSLMSPLTIVNSLFTDNVATLPPTNAIAAGSAGAIATDGAGGGEISLCGVVVKKGRAHAAGGGASLFAYAPDRITIDRSTFEGNVVEDTSGGGVGHGGAARVSLGGGSAPGAIRIKGSSFSSNIATGNGGALYVDCFGPCEITNSTFYGNRANGVGGAIQSVGLAADAGSPVFNNVTFASNAPGVLFGSGFTIHNSIFVAGSGGDFCSEIGAGRNVLQWPHAADDRRCVPDILAADPLLAAPANNGGPTSTMMPAPNSPVIGAGSDCESTDQVGVARDTAKCALGAVER